MEKETLYFFADTLRKYCASRDRCSGCIFKNDAPGVCCLSADPESWPDYEAEYNAKIQQNEYDGEPAASNCENGYPYDDACEKCADEGLAGDDEHKHCYKRSNPFFRADIETPTVSMKFKEVRKQIELVEE